MFASLFREEAAACTLAFNLVSADEMCYFFVVNVDEAGDPEAGTFGIHSKLSITFVYRLPYHNCTYCVFYRLSY